MQQLSATIAPWLWGEHPLKAGGDRQVGTALGGSQDDAAAERDLLRSSVGAQPLLNLLLLVGGEDQGTSRIWHEPTVTEIKPTV